MTSGSSPDQAVKTTRSRAKKPATAKETKPAAKRSRAVKAESTAPEEPMKTTATKGTKSAAKRPRAARADSPAPEKPTTKTTATTAAKPATKRPRAKTPVAEETGSVTAVKTARSRTTTTEGKKPVKGARVRATKTAEPETPEPTIAQITSGEIEVEVQRDGDDVVLKVGGKKRSLDDVDDSAFVEEKEATLEKELVEEEGFSLSDQDDADEPEQQVVSAGATADPVKDYLKQIGKVALLNAVEEVELAKRIEAGLFAEERLSDVERPIEAEDLEDFEWIASDGRLA